MLNQNIDSNRLLEVKHYIFCDFSNRFVLSNPHPVKFKINVFNTIPKQNFMIFNLIFMSHPKKEKEGKLNLII